MGMYPDGVNPPLWIKVTDVVLPIVIVITLLMVVAIPYLWWRADQQQQRFINGCHQAGGAVVSRNLCVSSDGRILDSR